MSGFRGLGYFATQSNLRLFAAREDARPTSVFIGRVKVGCRVTWSVEADPRDFLF